MLKINFTKLKFNIEINCYSKVEDKYLDQVDLGITEVERLTLSRPTRQKIAKRFS